MRARTLRLFFVAALAALSSPVKAQEFAPDPRVDSVFARYDRLTSPGCAVGAYRDDRIIYARGYGAADLERAVPITPRTVFDIGSTSKQFTAAVVLLLKQEGKLSLDDDVRKFIPELPVYERPITIRQLLNHTSGLRDYIGLLIFSGKRFDDVTTEGDALRIITRQRALNFAPGSEHLYSNSGYFLLSIIVERATGRSIRTEARERIFDPLGMRNTQHLGSYDDVIPHRALAYEPRAGGFRHDLPRWLQLGDGAVFTTVEDLLLWDRNFYTPTVGGRTLLDGLLTKGRLSDGREIDYAAGLIHEEFRGQRVVSHGGSWGGYRAELLRFPEQHYSVAVLCNVSNSDPSGLARAVAAIHLATVLQPVAASMTAPSRAGTTADGAAAAVSVPEQVLRSYAGTYRLSGGSSVFTVALVNGTLRMTEPGSYALAPRSRTVFAVLGGPTSATMTFEPPAAGSTTSPRMRWRVSDRPEQIFERVDGVSLTEQELSQFAGQYRSEELDDVVWNFAVKNGGIEATYPAGDPIALRALPRDEFSAGGLTIRFTRDDAGNVNGASLNQGRARNIRFQKLPSAR